MKHYASVCYILFHKVSLIYLLYGEHVGLGVPGMQTESGRRAGDRVVIFRLETHDPPAN
jgi:hypothetical protein